MMERNILEKFFYDLARVVERGEYAFVAFVSALIPWVAPLLPAALTYTHVRYTIDFGGDIPSTLLNFLAWDAGITIEGLGIVALNTIALLMAQHQGATRITEKVNPWVFVLVGAVGIMYIAILLSINVWMHVDPENYWAQLLAITGLSTMTIPASLIVSARNYRTQLRIAKEERDAELKQRRTNSRPVRDSSGQDTQMDKIPDSRKLLPTITDGQLINLSKLSNPEQILDIYGWPKNANTIKKVQRMMNEYIPKEMIKRGLAPPQG